MAGLVIPRKIALDLVAATDVHTLVKAVEFAATVQPSFGQRKLKYRMAAGIGAYRVQPLDTRAAQQQHRLEVLPSAALRVVVLPDFFVDAVVLNGGGSGRVLFRAVNPSDGTFNALAASYPWLDALANRSAEFLSNNGIQSTSEPITSRSW